jgi:hypothetical protein
MLSAPNDPMVLAAKEKIAKYSKSDWEKMSEDATHMTKMLGELVLYEIPVESKIAEFGFDALVDHFEKWFFTIDKDYLLKLAHASKYYENYSKFFNQFYPGLADYIHKLIPLYVKKF